MNVKKASVFSGSVMALLIAGTASADFSGMAWEEVDNGGLVPDGRTYRLVAVMNQGDRLDAVAGNQEQDLRLTSTGSFYQNSFGGAYSTDINAAFFSIAPSLEFDSFVTIGRTTNTDNGMNKVGLDTAVASFELGGSLEANNGTWFVTPDLSQGEAIEYNTLKDANGNSIGTAYGVLIAQVTVLNQDPLSAGTFSGKLQGKLANGDGWTADVNDFVYGSEVPAPGALALLGLAGLAGRRRRR